MVPLGGFKLQHFLNKMFSSVPLIFLAYLIMFTDNSLSQLESQAQVDACRQQTTYAIVTQITQPLTITLYYQAGKELEPDIGFLKAMCKAMKLFPKVTFLFIVGQGITKEGNGLKCAEDCVFNYEHACASQIVDFNLWICCVTAGGKGEDCVKSQDAGKVVQFNECVKLKDPKIKPVDILLANAAAAKAIENPSGCVPILKFNTTLEDVCARFMFYEDPEKVIKAFLAGKKP